MICSIAERENTAPPMHAVLRIATDRREHRHGGETTDETGVEASPGLGIFKSELWMELVLNVPVPFSI